MPLRIMKGKNGTIKITLTGLNKNQGESFVFILLYNSID